MSGIVAIDIGAHSGAFTRTCLERVCDYVFAYEPEESNFQRLVANVAGYDNVSCFNAAVWRSDGAGDPPAYAPYDHSGGGMCRPGSATMKWLAFDDIVLMAKELGKKVHVKMDCEGSEFPILLTSKTLHLVDRFMGEYHMWYKQIEGLETFSTDAIVKAFERAGRVCKIDGDPKLNGHFWVDGQ